MKVRAEAEYRDTFGERACHDYWYEASQGFVYPAENSFDEHWSVQ